MGGQLFSGNAQANGATADSAPCRVVQHAMHRDVNVVNRRRAGCFPGLASTPARREEGAVEAGELIGPQLPMRPNFGTM